MSTEYFAQYTSDKKCPPPIEIYPDLKTAVTAINRHASELGNGFVYLWRTVKHGTVYSGQYPFRVPLTVQTVQQSERKVSCPLCGVG